MDQIATLWESWRSSLPDSWEPHLEKLHLQEFHLQEILESIRLTLLKSQGLLLSIPMVVYLKGLSSLVRNAINFPISWRIIFIEGK